MPNGQIMGVPLVNFSRMRWGQYKTELRLRLEDVSRVEACVEITQCVGCTRLFFTKSFLGDDAAVLAPSSDEEPAPPRYRAGVASMAWRTTRIFSTKAP